MILELATAISIVTKEERGGRLGDVPKTWMGVELASRISDLSLRSPPYKGVCFILHLLQPLP